MTIDASQLLQYLLASAYKLDSRSFRAGVSTKGMHCDSRTMLVPPGLLNAFFFVNASNAASDMNVASPHALMSGALTLPSGSWGQKC